jgi:hypothetical protein
MPVAGAAPLLSFPFLPDTYVLDPAERSATRSSVQTSEEELSRLTERV